MSESKIEKKAKTAKHKRLIGAALQFPDQQTCKWIPPPPFQTRSLKWERCPVQLIQLQMHQSTADKGHTSSLCLDIYKGQHVALFL